MSADNYISIFKEDQEWCVVERSANGDEIEDLGGWADLESAVRCANAFMAENEVEYGLQINL